MSPTNRAIVTLLVAAGLAGCASRVELRAGDTAPQGVRVVSANVSGGSASGGSRGLSVGMNGSTYLGIALVALAIDGTVRLVEGVAHALSGRPERPPPRLRVETVPGARLSGACRLAPEPACGPGSVPD
jgi:hypothetical protein